MKSAKEFIILFALFGLTRLTADTKLFYVFGTITVIYLAWCVFGSFKWILKELNE